MSARASAPGLTPLDELLGYLRERFGETAELAEPLEPVQGGMDTEVSFIRLRGGTLDDEWKQPLVLRVHRSADRAPVAHHERDAQAWCIEHDYPAPRILLVGTDADGFTVPLQVMTRAPGTTMLTAMTARPWRMRQELHRLAALHAQLHALDGASWPNQTVTFAQDRLATVQRWTAELHDAEIDAARVRVTPIAVALDARPAVVCHGDFHPLNVIVDGDAATVIDWTDAGLGDPMGDVARTALLLRVAGVATPQPSLRAALTVGAPSLSHAYLRAYRQAAPFDPRRFELWTIVHLLHGWAQVRALHAGAVGSDSERDQIPKGLAPWLERRFRRAARQLP